MPILARSSDIEIGIETIQIARAWRRLSSMGKVAADISGCFTHLVGITLDVTP
jgi:hypothetical protein